MITEWVFFAIVPILVALIGILGRMLVEGKKAKRDNDSQHKAVSNNLTALMFSIRSLERKIDRVETKIDQHLGEHRGVRQRVGVGGK